MRAITAAPVFLFLVLIFLPFGAGCGSSGGGGGGGGGGDSRAKLLDEIAAKFESFDGTNPTQEDQQMLDYLRTKSEFTESGISPAGGVWARFSDGNTLVIANNVSRTPTRAAPLPITRSRKRISPSRMLPTSDSVIVGTALGSFFDTANQELVPMLVDQNYTVLENGGSVETLRTFTNLSVLYLTGHGIVAPIHVGAEPVFIAWTSTQRARDGSTDRAYSADLADGSLTYFMGLTFNGDENSLQRRAEVHYGFTSKFVEKYWKGKFNKNSMVFLNACSSASPQGMLFALACANAGASVYFGWTDTMVIRDGVISAAYLLDRLLGANTFDDKESPPQRSFSYGAVLADMAATTRPYINQKYDSTLNPHTGRVAKLIPVSLGGTFTQLAPSIEGLFVDEQKDELTVAGQFGDPRGDVFINENPMTIKSWSSTRIVCALPRTGQDASGDVYVRAGAPRQKSNTVQLTEWRGTITCTEDAEGSLKAVWTINLHFRADVHARRIAPGQDPVFIASNFQNALDTAGTFTFSGVYVQEDGLYREQWSGSGSLPAAIAAQMNRPTSVIAQGFFDAQRRWSLSIDALAKSANSVRRITYDNTGKVLSDETKDESMVWISVGDMQGSLTLTTATEGWDIPAGSVRQQTDADRSRTISWTAMQANNPPAASAARSRR